MCEQYGKEFYPNSTRQRFCNTDCTKAHQQDEKEKKRYAEKGEHTFRQKVCKICGKLFWPSNGQEVLCSEECTAINPRQTQLAYYHRKQSGQKAGEAIKFKEDDSMEEFITDERTGLCYELVGDYYLIAGEDEPEGRPIGIWGQ